MIYNAPALCSVLTDPNEDDLRMFAPRSSLAQIFLKLATKKGDDKLLPKRPKKLGSPTSFWRDHAPKNTLNLKNRASLADRAIVFVSHKMLQLSL